VYSHQNEPVVFDRDCEAVLIPAGEKVSLAQGTSGYVTQALGGSFTVYIEGNLFRVAGIDADAIGKEPIRPPIVPEDASDEEFESVIWDQMRTCFDPEIPINVVDLGLVYECRVEKTGLDSRNIQIRMTLTSPGCGMGEILTQDVREKIEIVPTVARADVELVFDPPWSQSMMSEEARLEAGLF
jgi:probable FeS assembly SUF system protein SufT